MLVTMAKYNSVLAASVDVARKIPNSKILYYAYTKESISQVFHEAIQFYQITDYNVKDKLIRFENGSEIKFRYEE